MRGARFEIELEGGWAPFEPRVAMKLAEAEALGQHRVEYSARRQQYVLDLLSMEQINKLSGKRRRIRRVGAALANGLGTSRGEAGPEGTSSGSLAGAPYTPSVPAAFPELMQVGESELGRLKASRDALDAFIPTVPQARVLVDQARAVREENGRLRTVAIAGLASGSQEADAEAEECLQRALDTPGVMDITALASLRDQFLQHKVDKQRRLIAKKRLECTDAEWHALCMTPATARGGLH